MELERHGRHFQEELEQLKTRLLEMGGLAEEQVRLAVKALTERDRELVALALNGDEPINRLHIEIDGRCFTLLALHQPMAVDLRAIVAAVKINTDLERVAEHRLRDIAHLRDVDELLHWRMRGVPFPGFRDVDREISDPFEVGVDLDGRDDCPQVGRHRLVQRQQLEAAIVDLDVEFVDRLVAVQDPVDHLDVAGRQPVDGRADALFGEATHLEQPALEHFELLLEMSNDTLHLRDSFDHDGAKISKVAKNKKVGGHQPNLPVR